MARDTVVSVEQYLNTSYEPECEYLEGELVELNGGRKKHARLQAALSAYFYVHREAWGIDVLTEQRVRLRETRYRVPDLCVTLGRDESEEILTSPPFIWIEILSTEDRPIRVQQKVCEVLDFGCPWVWVIDPETLESRIYTATSDYSPEDATLRIPGADIVVPLREL
jgi:Uma2 family endonuclease